MGEFDEPLMSTVSAIADTAAANEIGSKMGELDEPLKEANQEVTDGKLTEISAPYEPLTKGAALLSNSANKETGDIDESPTAEGTEASETPLTVSLSPETKVCLEDWMRFGPHCHDSEFDPLLAARLVSVLQCQGISGNFFSSDQDTGPDEDTQRAMWLTLRCFRLLHLCQYCDSDIEVIVAHASLYLEDLMEKLRGEGEPEMEIKEISRILCLLIFLAHSYIMDQTCKLHVWHKHLFARYCTLRTLSNAVLRLMEHRGFVLRVDATLLESRVSWLRDGGL